MDKEKQIEEMAKIICRTVNGKELKHCEVQCDIDCIGIAKELVNENYRKINENEAVISKKKLEKLQRIENIIKRFSTISPTEAEMENKALKETIGIILAQKRNIWKSYNSLKEDFDKIKEQARKETAEKILKEILFVKSIKGWQENKQLVEFCNRIVDKIEELAKDFGVETGEEDE